MSGSFGEFIVCYILEQYEQTLIDIIDWQGKAGKTSLLASSSEYHSYNGDHFTIDS